MLELTLTLATFCTGSLLSAEIPETTIEPVEDTYHGQTVVDPYRWLEGSAAPEADKESAERLDARVSTWIDAQNAHTRAVLDGLPGRAALEARLRELMEVGEIKAPAAAGNRYFYQRRDGGQAQWVALVREGEAEPRVLVDPNALYPDGLTAIGWIEPNQNGTLLAFGLFRAGDENTTLYILEVETGDWLADEIPGKVRGLSWLPDGSGFLYHRLADVANAYSSQIKLHRIGAHHRHDKLLFEQYKEGPLATTWGPWGVLSRDARWLALGYWTGTDSNDLWVADFDAWMRTGKLTLIDVTVGDKATSSGPIVGDTMYMRTTLGAPNARVVAVDLHHPERARWRDVIPERKGSALETVAVARGRLVATYLKDAANTVELFEMSGKPLGPLELPGIGSAEVAVAEDRTEAFLTYTSFNEPTSIYRVDLRSGERTLWERPDVPVDPSLFAVKQVFFKSKDKTDIPMFIIHRKGLELNGENPTILGGYGGFNISLTPSFSSTRVPWIEGGGVYAIANLRGGGEYGETWHRAGMLDQKQNVFDDFIAAGEWLVKNGYTRRERLGIYGGSNGGLLTGAAIVQRPDLFSAVISAVPLLDMLRYQNFLMARYWVPEYGSSEAAEQFAFLRKYSPYHNVEPGVNYPAVLFTAGENDTRVHMLHALKMAARVQAASASDATAEPVLLWVDRSSGHGGGKPLELRIRDVADERIFMMHQLGMVPTDSANAAPKAGERTSSGADVTP